MSNLFSNEWKCIVCDAPQGICDHSWGRVLALDFRANCRVLEDWHEPIYDNDGHRIELLMYKAGEDIRPEEARRIFILGAKIAFAPGEAPMSDKLDPPPVFTEEEMLGGVDGRPSGADS